MPPRCVPATIDVQGILFEGDFVTSIPVVAEELILSPDMAGTLMTPEEFDGADVDPDEGSRYDWK